MNLKAFTLSAAILTAILLPSTLPANAQTPNADLNQPLVVGGEEYVVLNSLPITINRNNVGAPIQQTEMSANGRYRSMMNPKNVKAPTQQTKVSTDGRYRFVSFLNAITQEREEVAPPAARQLYRLAHVQDTETGKIIKAALPLRFEP